MLSTHLAWLSDAYKPTLVQEAKILKQLEAFGRGEKTGCENGHHNVTQLLDSSNTICKPRVQSAPVLRSGLPHTCRQSQAFSEVKEDGSKTGSNAVLHRPSSAKIVSSRKSRHQAISATLKETGNNRSRLTEPGTSPRPTSGHTRPLGRPRSAWGVQNKESRHPLDKLTVLSQSLVNRIDSVQPPPSPADSGFSFDTSTLSSDGDQSRDVNECNKNIPQIVVQSSESACSSRSQTPSCEDLSPWLEDPRVGLSIGYESDPRILYFDRHTRCRGKGVDGHPLSKWRPREQRGSSGSLSSSGPWLAPRLRPASGTSDPERNNSKVQRYVDCHRPQTAPSTRKDLQGLVVSNQHEYLPHYCSFVRGIPLQGRSGQENEADDGYITNSEQSPTEADLQSRKLRSTIQGSRAGHDNSGNKQAGPNSTSSVVISGNGRLPGSTSDLTTPAVEQTDPQITSVQKEVILENMIVISSPPLPEVDDATESVMEGSRQPIQIPTHDAESDVMESARPKFEETVDLVELLTNTKVRDTKGLSRKPLTSAKTRRSCPKKGKMPGKTKKRKGRKKGSKETEADEKGEGTQLDEQNEGGLSSGLNTELSFDLQVPGLPELDLTQKGHTKSNRGKANKTPIGPPVLLDKTVAQVVPDEPTYNFYDFGDLAATTAAMEEIVTPKSTSAPSSVNDRMVLSLQSSRFELPMDMRQLEQLTPQDYLRKYCIITTRRRSLYQKMFQKHRGKSDHIQGKLQLCEALKDVLVNTITYSQAEELCDLLEVDDETLVDFELFSGMAALAERILYPEFLTEATADKTEYQKEKVECADFSALEWKLHGVKVSQPVRKILNSL